MGLPKIMAKVSRMYNYRELRDEALEYIVVATTDELADGDRLVVEIDWIGIVLFKIGGEYYAIGDVCSHDDGPIAEGELEGLEIACPRHGARFALQSGKVLALPAVADIPAYPVRVEGEEILVGLPVDMA
jgi:3-phenylpropionate/trans-cinnamate dioxygenase ferredoxin subunit